MESAMINLISSDGKSTVVPENHGVIQHSKVISHIISDRPELQHRDENPFLIPLPNVSGEVLGQLVDVSSKRDDGKDIRIKDYKNLEELLWAADYLGIDWLVDLTCQHFADSMEGKSVDEIKVMFNIVSEYLPEEEAALRSRYKWAF